MTDELMTCPSPKAFLLDIAGDPQQIPCFVETNHGLLISSLLEAGFPIYP
jgi:hypothetical protein